MHTVLQARDLSVVIPTYNRGDVLPRALESRGLGRVAGTLRGYGGKGQDALAGSECTRVAPVPRIWLLQGRYRDLIAEIGARMRKRRR
jgi:hypothetical protein